MSKEAPPPYSGAPAPGFNPPETYPPGTYPPAGHVGPQTTHHTEHRVMVTTGNIGGPLLVGPNPMPTVCPFCHSSIVSTVETEANTKTHLFALLLCVFGCWPCCLIPYCMESCQSKKHFCPNCRAFLGTFSD
ncbi:lipopolysaccharide-induced tumor necrosis factor-alpha factor homolog [Euwallacea similis]|uniref:lipopolysaccharide-induced tumor necrosis factor-alpha factor homolog n=1 Tax=Euwallacea similis TaxID=1736056 RepID=UPI00344B079B